MFVCVGECGCGCVCVRKHMCALLRNRKKKRKKYHQTFCGLFRVRRHVIGCVNHSIVGLCSELLMRLSNSIHPCGSKPGPHKREPSSLNLDQSVLLFLRISIISSISNLLSSLSSIFKYDAFYVYCFVNIIGSFCFAKIRLNCLQNVKNKCLNH